MINTVPSSPNSEFFIPQELEKSMQRRQAENSNLEKRIDMLTPQITEANLMAAEFNHYVTLSVKILAEISESERTVEELRSGVVFPKTLMVKCENRRDGYYVLWSEDKFENRLHLMREIYTDFLVTDEKL